MVVQIHSKAALCKKIGKIDVQEMEREREKRRERERERERDRERIKRAAEIWFSKSTKIRK